MKLATADEYRERKRSDQDARSKGEIVPGFTVYVPCLTWERSYGNGYGGRTTERETRREVRLDRDLAKVTRGGLGHVWIGHRMVDPHELLDAIEQVRDLESDNRDPDRVGFEWWVEGGSERAHFKLRAGYAGEVAIEQENSYGTSRDIFRIDDLLDALATLGVLEDEGPQTLAPAAGTRPQPKVPVATEEELVEAFVLPRPVLIGALIFATAFGAAAVLLIGWLA